MSAPATARRRGLTLAELVLLASLGVVFGFLYWALVQVWGWLQLAMGPFGDLAQHVLIGGWMVVAPLALYVVRRPGVGVVAELLAATIEVVFLGSPVGPMLLLVGFVQGAGAELAFALTRYRRYGWGVFVASGVTAALASLALGTVRFGWLTQDLFAYRVVLEVVSAIVLSGLLAKVLGDALLRTGVLDDHAIGRAARTRGADPGRTPDGVADDAPTPEAPATDVPATPRTGA